MMSKFGILLISTEITRRTFGLKPPRSMHDFRCVLPPLAEKERFYPLYFSVPKIGLLG
jgi:hypothetical protein